MAIITNHIDFTRDFTQIPNTWVRDTRLSHRARGVLAVLMSHRDGWQTSTDYLVRNGKEGRDAIRKAIAELVDFGYLERVTIKRDGGGLAGSMYVTKHPQSDGFSGPQESAPRATGFQAVGFSGPQESPPKNTNVKEDQSEEHQEEVREPPARSTAVAAVTLRPEIDQLCGLLAGRIEANGSKRPTITKRWEDACRLMLDRDGRTPEQIAYLINWAQSDSFWRSNILSMPKLRDKFDQLRLQATSRNGPSKSDQRAENILRMVQDMEGGGNGHESYRGGAGIH